MRANSSEPHETVTATHPITATRLPANSTGAATFINALICPTDAAPPVLITVGGQAYASHNYNLNVGSNYPLQATFPSSFTSPCMPCARALAG